MEFLFPNAISILRVHTTPNTTTGNDFLTQSTKCGSLNCKEVRYPDLLDRAVFDTLLSRQSRIFDCWHTIFRPNKKYCRFQWLYEIFKSLLKVGDPCCDKEGPAVDRLVSIATIALLLEQMPDTWSSGICHLVAAMSVQWVHVLAKCLLLKMTCNYPVVCCI